MPGEEECVRFCLRQMYVPEARNGFACATHTQDFGVPHQCPYSSAAARLQSQHPCSDFQPLDNNSSETPTVAALAVVAGISPEEASALEAAMASNKIPPPPQAGPGPDYW